MDLDSLVTAGAITQILDGHKPVNPVLQIIGYKPMTPDQMAFGNVTEDLRYRLMIGDGVTAHQYCVITNQDLVNDIKNGHLEKWSVIKVTSYQTVDYGDGPPANKRRLIYILNLEIVKRGTEVGRKLVSKQTDFGQQPSVAAPINTNQNRNNLMPNQPYGNQPAPNQPFGYQPMQQQSMNRPQSTNNYPDTQPQPYPMGGMQQNLISSPRVMRSSSDHQTIGIGELTPYIGKWVVKGRVTSKSQIREYNNAKGGGKLFNFTLADKTGEIKITAFNADCERVFAYVEPNKVYLLGRASVKNADKRYTTADFEITLNNDSLLEEVVDTKESSDVPLARFNFVSIGQVPSLQPNQPADLIGAIQSVSEVSTIVSKNKNKELKKRNVTIVDMSRHSIGVTIWGDQADTFDGTVGDVFVTKAARIGTYGGRSASAGDCIFVNPDIPEVRKVKNWYAGLIDNNFTALTSSQDAGPNADQWKFLAQAANLENAKNVASSGNTSGMYSKCKATIMSVGKNPVYKCCPTDGCGKKLIDTQSGELKCEKCQQTYSTYKYRYKTDIEVGDSSSSQWVTLWDEKAEAVFQMKPDELEKYMKMDNKDTYERILTRPNFKNFIFTVRARLDTYNQEERVKLNVVGMVPLDCVTYSKRLIEEIKSFGST